MFDSDLRRRVLFRVIPPFSLFPGSALWTSDGPVYRLESLQSARLQRLPNTWINYPEGRIRRTYQEYFQIRDIAFLFSLFI